MPWQAVGTVHPCLWLWLHFGFPPGCGCQIHPPYAPGKGFVSSQIKSLVLLAAEPHGHELWHREGTGDRGALWAAGLVSAMAGEKSKSTRGVLGSRVAEDASGTASSWAQGMGSKGRDSPLGLLGTGTASGPAPQRPSSEGCWMEGQWAGLHMAGGPRHPRVTVPAPGNAAVTMARGRIKGSILPCPTARADLAAAWRHARGSPGGARGMTWRELREEDQRLDEAAGGSPLQGQLPAAPCSKPIGGTEILLQPLGNRCKPVTR